MEIITNGRKLDKLKYFGVCGCGCSFTADFGEYEFKMSERGTYCEAKCPNCSHLVELELKTIQFIKSRKTDESKPAISEAHWEEYTSSYDDSGYMCSKCGFDSMPTNYCGNCGAKMNKL